MIEVSQLSKVYRVHKREPGLKAAVRSLFSRPTEEVRAVDGISFQIRDGERLGFLGPNGAGKTTTLKMLAGLLHPSAGTVQVDGFTPQKRERAFLQRITLELAAALLHRPRVLFLDEPTIGLDVAMQATVREFIRAYNARFEATVLLTSHDMDDVAALCPRVIVIDHGKLIWDGALEDLAKRMRPHKRIKLRLAKAVDAKDLAALGQIIEHSGNSATIQVSQAELQSSVSRLLGTLPLVDLSVEDPPLEEVMRDLFAGANPESAKAPDAA